jgi:hypothetical protein
VQIARAEHEVVVGGQLHELGQHRRWMRAVGIHLNDEVRLEREGGAKAFLVCRTDAHLRAVIHQVDAGIGGRHLGHHGRRAIGRIVVDHDHLTIGRRQHLGHELADRFALVVRGNDDDGPGHRRHHNQALRALPSRRRPRAAHVGSFPTA